MTGAQFREIREGMGLQMVPFAVLLGYRGDPKNIRQTIHRYETSYEIPPLVARLAWLLGEIHANRAIALDDKRSPRWPVEICGTGENDG